MDFSKMSDDEFEVSILRAVRNERESTAIVLRHIREAEVRRLYSKRKQESLFEYVMKFLGYTEDEAGRRISAMRLLRELPQIEEKIESGALTLSHLTMTQAMFRREKKANRPRTPAAKLDVLTRVEKMPIRDLKKTLEMETYAPLPPKPVEAIKLEQFPAELQLQLKQLLDLRSHTLDGRDLIALIGQLAELGLEKWDPIRKEARIQKSREVRAFKNDAVVPATSRVNGSGKLTAETRRVVFVRDQSRCTNCGSTHHLQIDHIVPLILGGTNELSNLRLRCRSCNLRHAVETYGRSNMQRYVREPVQDYGTNPAYQFQRRFKVSRLSPGTTVWA